MASKIRIVEVKEVSTKEGRKFPAFKTVDNKGNKMDVKFVRDCKNIPTKPCTIIVNDGDANVDTRKQFPVLWIKNVAKIEENAIQQNNITAFLDVESVDDLPF